MLGRPFEWDAAEAAARPQAECRRIGQAVRLALVDNGCNSALINHCALNTYWLPEGRGEASSLRGEASRVAWSSSPGRVVAGQTGPGAFAGIVVSAAPGQVAAAAAATAATAAAVTASGAAGTVTIGAPNSIVLRSASTALQATASAGGLAAGRRLTGGNGAISVAGAPGTAPLPLPDLAVTLSGAASVDEDATFTITYEITGDDAGTVTDITIDWGDGTVEDV